MNCIYLLLLFVPASRSTATTVKLLPEFIIESAVLPVSVYEGLINNFKYVPISPITEWRWRRSVIAFKEEPETDGTQVWMKPTQLERMTKDWDLDYLRNWESLRKTVRMIAAQGVRKIGELHAKTVSLGFTASKNQIKNLLDNSKRRRNKSVICLSPRIKRLKRNRNIVCGSRGGDTHNVGVRMDIVDGRMDNVDASFSGAPKNSNDASISVDGPIVGEPLSVGVDSIDASVSVDNPINNAEAPTSVIVGEPLSVGVNSIDAPVSAHSPMNVNDLMNSIFDPFLFDMDISELDELLAINEIQ